MRRSPNFVSSFVGVPVPTGSDQQVEIPADRQLSDWVHRRPGIAVGSASVSITKASTWLGYAAVIEATRPWRMKANHSTLSFETDSLPERQSTHPTPAGMSRAQSATFPDYIVHASVEPILAELVCREITLAPLVES